MQEVTRAIITNKEEKVLLGKRTRGTGAGLFGLVGGKPNKGESPNNAIIREVKEEIGLDFEPIPFIERIDSSSDPSDPWMVYYFVGKVNGNLKLDSSEVESIIYVSEDELSDVEIAFDHREI